jgi:hypothetical protein
VVYLVRVTLQFHSQFNFPYIPSSKIMITIKSKYQHTNLYSVSTQASFILLGKLQTFAAQYFTLRHINEYDDTESTTKKLYTSVTRNKFRSNKEEHVC